MMRLFVPASLALLVAACSPDVTSPDQQASPAAGPSGTEAAATTPASAAADAGSGAIFRYSSLDGCTLTRSAPEEAGFFEHECPGAGGYRLRHTEADLRENLIVLAPGGGEHDLGLSALANGAFSSLGETVEWRGEAAGGGFTPAALIVRQSVMETPDPDVPEVSYLVAARLTPTPCVVARIPPGQNQNGKAREAADSGGECLATSP